MNIFQIIKNYLLAFCNSNKIACPLKKLYSFHQLDQGTSLCTRILHFITRKTIPIQLPLSYKWHSHAFQLGIGIPYLLYPMPRSY